MKEAEARYNVLVSWGIKFYEEGGKTFILTHSIGGKTCEKLPDRTGPSMFIRNRRGTNIFSENLMVG